jgi:4-hydroxyphenylpyruvate dioxygenase-like putative hemolysin
MECMLSSSCWLVVSRLFAHNVQRSLHHLRTSRPALIALVAFCVKDAYSIAHKHAGARWRSAWQRLHSAIHNPQSAFKRGVVSMIRGIDHIEIIVRDIDESIAFFQKLGFELLTRTAHHRSIRLAVRRTLASIISPSKSTTRARRMTHYKARGLLRPTSPTLWLRRDVPRSTSATLMGGACNWWMLTEKRPSFSSYHTRRGKSADAPASAPWDRW